MAGIEQHKLKVGIARLSDSVVIAAARERGEFEREGLDVEITRHDSWAAIRDQLAFGEIDAAHLLSPIVVASAAGLGPFPGQFTTSFAINLNGNAITVSNALIAEMTAAGEGVLTRPATASGLARIAAHRRATGAPQLCMAVVYPYSMHNYELRYWLAAGGVHPDLDVRIVVVPPSRMVDALGSGEIDGYCVGEPWNSEAIRRQVGRTLITSSEIWSNGPEKVLGVRREWANVNPSTHKAMIRALLRAARWVDDPGNRQAAAQIVAGPDYLDMPVERIASSLTGMGRMVAGGETADMPDFNVFHRYAANFPWRSHAMWILAQMVRWGQAGRDTDIRRWSIEAFNPAPYRAAAQAEGVSAPASDYKVEGAHCEPWVLSDASSPIALGADLLMDGRAFDPDNVDGYLDSFEIHSMRRTRQPADQPA